MQFFLTFFFQLQQKLKQQSSFKRIFSYISCHKFHWEKWLRHLIYFIDLAGINQILKIRIISHTRTNTDTYLVESHPSNAKKIAAPIVFHFSAHFHYMKQQKKNLLLLQSPPHLPKSLCAPIKKRRISQWWLFVCYLQLLLSVTCHHHHHLQHQMVAAVGPVLLLLLLYSFSRICYLCLCTTDSGIVLLFVVNTPIRCGIYGYPKFHPEQTDHSSKTETHIGGNKFIRVHT